MTQLWCESALVDGRARAGVLIDVVDGRIARIEVGAAPGDAQRLAGVTLPGLANAHSHAFHRALRARTQADRGTFWTWRDLMYRAADRLDPDRCHRLARGVFAEMALAGVTCVGEFHYVHHQPGGTAYADPNEMGHALLAAADDVGIRITLLDTLYLHGGLERSGHIAPTGVQLRFGDGTARAWGERVQRLEPTDTRRIGAAIHSVRAVDAASMQFVGDWASAHDAPVHVHLSEQVQENEACRAHHGVSPTEVLIAAGVLSPRCSVVHATHVDGSDIEGLSTAGATVVMCPTTERDLGDGIGPTREFAAAAVPIALGSDSNAVIDLFEEARAMELDERLRSQSRGVHAVAALLDAATVHGHRSLGWDDAGALAVGNRADLVAVALDSVRTAGAAPRPLETAVFAATAADVTDVFVDGVRIVSGGRHRSIDVARDLDVAIRELLDDV